MIPQELQERYQSIRQILSRDGAGTDIWLTQDLVSHHQVVIKLSRLNRVPAPALVRLLQQRQAAGTAPPLSLPLAHGQTNDGRWYEVNPFYPAGSLAGQFERGHDEVQLEDLVKQMVSALVMLHEQIPGGPVVHGDIKPSNILLERRADGTVRYLLADFETARQFDGGEGEHPTSYTLRYAAPEVIGGGTVSPAIDYWSLGMTLLECLNGTHPLEGLQDSTIRSLLTTTWRPDQIARLEDIRWRALLSGLLDRNPWNRWGATQCRRWLDGDPSVITDGLNRLAEEDAASAPYEVEGTPVITAHNLAQALLEGWRTNQLTSPSLPHWIQNELHRPDLAALLDRLNADAQTPTDMKLLRFCHALHANMPIIWRGRELSANNLQAAGQAARTGDTRNLEWLQSLLDGTVFQFYGQHGHPEIEELGQRYLDGWANYQQAWNEIIAQGAPENARPGDDQALPLLASTLFSEDARNTLRANARDFLSPATLLLREPWFLRFGTGIDEMTEAQLLVLRHMDHTSQLSLQQIGVLGELGEVDAQQLSRGAVFLETQRRLLHDMHVAGGSDITVLNAGELHRSRPAERLMDFAEQSMRRVGGHIRQRLARISERLMRKLRIPAPSINEEDLWIQLRMVRLVSPGVAEDMPLDGEAYLAMVSWRTAEGLRPRLRITYPGYLLTYPRLFTPVLAGQGHLLLVLASDTRIELEARHHWYQRWRRTEGIDILFRDTPRQMSARGHIVPTRAGILSAIRIKSRAGISLSRRMKESKGSLLGLRDRIHVTRSHSINSIDTRTNNVRDPSRFEKRLWEALSTMSKAR